MSRFLVLTKKERGLWGRECLALKMFSNKQITRQQNKSIFLSSEGYRKSKTALPPPPMPLWVGQGSTDWRVNTLEREYPETLPWKPLSCCSPTTRPCHKSCFLGGWSRLIFWDTDDLCNTNHLSVRAYFLSYSPRCWSPDVLQALSTWPFSWSKS